ncbi:kinase-like protein, partial [Stereum hirsutum FP-91666 SS1]|uniref:kinase-like protein n=1 Tax=Stereum hirsutum (strain FP-91666) TaxID=721885 RepID=UPI000440C0AD
MPTMEYTIHKPEIGKGGFSRVFRGTDMGCGRAVALKKSRCSLVIKKPHLRHESRILQLLQSHPAIPAIYGYAHLPHFEYLAMELLGESVSDLQPDGTKIAPKTVVSVVLQTMSALQHIHKLGIVHRDIKQGNLMCSLNDPSRIKLIDFGISRMFYEGEPKRRDPATKGYKMVGTLDWASLNAHDGIALSARDDFESLAHVALDLLRGDLPWGYRPWLEPRRIAQEEVRASKRSHTAESLGAGFPPEFSSLLTYSRSLRFNQLPDY